MIYIQHYNSCLGGITLASDGDALTGLWFDGQKYFAGNIDDEIEEKDVPVFVQARQWLDIYSSGHDPGFTPALTLDSTPFRRAVWEILLPVLPDRKGAGGCQPKPWAVQSVIIPFLSSYLAIGSLAQTAV